MRKSLFLILQSPCWTIVLLLLLAPHLFAQADSAPDSQDQPPVLVMSPLPAPADGVPTSMQPDLTPPAVPDSYVIGKNDLLSIFVYQMPEITRQVRVAEDGTVRLPLLSNPIPAAGKVSRDVASAIKTALVQQGLAVAPVVQVIVRQVMSRPIVVAGAVKNPLVIEAARPMHLLEVLARAGGLGTQAGTHVLLTQNTDTGSVTREINLANLTETTDPTENPLLTGGEVIRVLPARLVYAVGALQHPGAFPIHSTEPLTILKAIALSQGFSTTQPADRRHAEIIRQIENGQRKEIPINLDKILKHESPDETLLAGDILYVPENGKRKVLTAVLQDAGQVLVIGLGYNTRVF